VLEALDAAIPGIPLAQAFGRWGNYFNQELFGTPTKLPWALEVQPQYRPDRYAGFETFHPTFLYESLYNLVVVAVLIWIGRTKRLRAGSLVLCYAILYATGRFLLELLRTDTTYRLAGLSRNAYVSILVVVAAATVLVLRERRDQAEAEPAAEDATAEGERAEREATEPADGEATAATSGDDAVEVEAPADDAVDAAAEDEATGAGEAPAAEEAAGEPTATEEAERQGQPERR
jgi:hypothetical protein